MKKVNDIFVLIIGTLLFIISYTFDENVALFFKGAKLPILDAVLSTITNFGVVVVVILLVPSIVLYKKNKKLVYLLWFTLVISFILSFIIKLLVLRQRPMEEFIYPLINIINYSFPSMHALVIFSLLPLLVKYLPKWKHFWVLFAFLIAFSRIYFGFHFLSDVVFGIIAGYFVGDFLLKLYEKKNYGKNRKL